MMLDVFKLNCQEQLQDWFGFFFPPMFSSLFFPPYIIATNIK